MMDSASAEPTVRVACIVATLESRHASLITALESVAAQTRLPDEVIVVVDHELDSDAVAYAERVGMQLRHTFGERSATRTKAIVNWRTKNMSGTGAWNSALHELELDSSFVALLDDDDQWLRDHVAQCVQCVDNDVEWVVSGIERRTEDGLTVEQVPSAADVCESAFLCGNPGVQGSNLFMRLSLLRRIGLFDEALPSSTDRDVCVRAIDALGTNVGAGVRCTGCVTVVHCDDGAHVRARVSTNVESKRRGLRAFLWKHAHRYSDNEWQCMKVRQAELFGIDVDNLLLEHETPAEQLLENAGLTAGGHVVALQPSTHLYIQANAAQLRCEKDGNALRGLYGIVSSDVARLKPLLDDICALHTNATLLVFVNTNSTSDSDDIEAAVRATGCGSCVLFAHARPQAIAASFYRDLNRERPPSQTSFEIAVARTVLQVSMLERLNEAVAFDYAVVLDDDKRLPSTSLLTSSALAELDQSVLYVGRDCKSAPNTLAFGMRVQLLDWWFTISGGGSVRAVSALRDITVDDDYYDVSTSHFNHLEAPRRVEDVRKCGARVLRGEPLARDVLPPIHACDTTQRGGCMLLFTPNFHLLECPQYVPDIIVDRNDGTSMLSRRSDSLWMARSGVPCRVHPALFVFHESACNGAPPTPSTIRRNALAETFGSILCRTEPERLAYMRRRLALISANNERIRTLLRLLRTSGVGDDDLRALDVLEQAFDANRWQKEVFKPLQRNFGRSFVGSGAEGVVFRDERGTCTKVFRGELTPPMHALPNCRLVAPQVLTYSYVHGAPYKGGHERAMIACMRRMRSAALVMNNVKPANLVVTPDGASIEIVDFGRDWCIYTVDGFRSMCARAFLSVHFAHVSPVELQQLMRRQLQESDLPEMRGFEAFLEQCSNGDAVDAAATLIIKTCLMEAQSIVANVRHIVHTLRRAGTSFDEIVLAVDRSRRRNLVRQYTAIDESAFDTALNIISREKLVDRVHDFSGTDLKALRALNHKYLGLRESLATHSETGAPHAALFSALDTVRSPLAFQLDADICLNMHEAEDLVARAASIFERDERIVTTLALPIYFAVPPRECDNDADAQHRFEIRCSFLHMERFQNMLPLVQSDQRAPLDKWYRVFDENLCARQRLSVRFVSCKGFFVHPPNELKRDLNEYMLTVDRVASRPRHNANVWRLQSGNVNVFAYADGGWAFGERCEPIVFVIYYTSNVDSAKVSEALRTLQHANDADAVGVVLVDDTSTGWPGQLFDVARRLFPEHVTCINTGVHMGCAFTFQHTVRRVCTNRHSIVVLLDLSIGTEPDVDVVQRVRKEFCNASTFYDHFVGAIGELRCVRKGLYDKHIDSITMTDHPIAQIDWLSNQAMGYFGPPLVAPECKLSDDIRLVTFAPNPILGTRCVVRVRGKVRNATQVPVRIHSECLSGDIMRSERCDCGEQLSTFLDLMQQSTCAVLVHVSGHEGRGHGLEIKMKEYALNDEQPLKNHVTILRDDFHLKSIDVRDYGDAVRILHNYLGIADLVLYSNNPAKRQAVEHVFGAERVRVQPMRATITPSNARYLHEKVRNLGHDAMLVSKGPSFDVLQRVVADTLASEPFENISLVLGQSGGGLCFDVNARFAETLTGHYGFAFADVRMIGAYTALNTGKKVHDHVMLVVAVAGERYVVDVGNASPYLTPLRLPADEASHFDLRYRVRKCADDMFVVEHDRAQRREWRANYRFRVADTLNSASVERIVRSHQANVSFGPMLTHVRISIWRESLGVVVRDELVRVVRASSGVSECITFARADEWTACIAKHFGDDMVSSLCKCAPYLLQNIAKLGAESRVKLVSLLKGIAHSATPLQ